MAHKLATTAIIFALISSNLCLEGCATVDQFGTRINDANLNSQSSLDEETLLNILRSSRYEPLTFVAISQITGGQTEAETLGLPNVILAPSKAVQAGPYSFSSSIASGQSGGYQSSPLVSTTFQEGVLSPITPRSIALLAASHPRDQVLYTAIDSIIVTNADTGEISALRNDPQQDYPLVRADSKGSFDTEQNYQACQQSVSAEVDRDLKQKSSSVFFDGRRCSYSKFLNLMAVLIDNGLSAELLPSQMQPTPKATAALPGQASPSSSSPSTGTSDQTKISKGHFCFDPALISINIAAPQQPTCGAAKAAIDATAPAASFSDRIKIRLLNNQHAYISFKTRSLISVYQYLGEIYRTRPPFSGYESLAAVNVPDSERIINISDKGESGCFVSTIYHGQFSCVPLRSSNTALMFDIVENLRNLSIQSSDLNSAFTVRLTSQ